MGIKDSGDWTHGLHTMLNPSGAVGPVQDFPRHVELRVDGGLGAASEDCFKFEHVMLVGAGIGVTPFASVLRSIQYTIHNEHEGGYRFDEDGNDSPLLGKVIRTVSFYWVMRDEPSWEWFTEMLLELESHAGKYLEINRYVTRSRKSVAAKMSRIEPGRREQSRLMANTHYGRPDWDAVFAEKARAYRGTKVGVFFCGPKALSTELRKQCHKHTNT